MKIENITIQGFRGFNKEKSITMHPALTLFYGPNSYGKTSITEAVEWLIYGRTSKVATGESKEEYKGSYRNCHIAEEYSTFVKVRFLNNGVSTEFEAELAGEDGMEKRVDGKMAEQWPLSADLGAVAKPFIMQHALKYLLLVGPDDRFKGFASLLGLEELGLAQSDFVSLCTKPESSIPKDVSLFLGRVSSIESRLSIRPTLKDIWTLYKKGNEHFANFNTSVWNECKRRVPEGTPDESVMPTLLRIRDEAIKKVFPGRIILTPYSAEDNTSNAIDSEYFLKFGSEDLIKKYCELIALTAREAILKQADFYNLGIEILKQKTTECPFCGQKLDQNTIDHINKEHEGLKKQREHSGNLLNQKQAVIESFSELKRRLDRCQQRHNSRLTVFLSINDSLKDLPKIFLPKHEPFLKSVQDAVLKLQKVKEDLVLRHAETSESLGKLQLSVTQSKEDIELMEDLGVRLIAYTDQVNVAASSINTLVTPMADANEILKHELDLTAGTEDISLLIELVEKSKEIKKAMEIGAILSDLKELRKVVDQYVGSKMLEAITNEMSGDVMDWYKQIRTTGDPDVHFSGFDLERTKKGELKSRRVQIKASSYGKDLVSAVSSLSESKLNALGLCLSIATNLKPGCPFDFLFIDDPIQSWDEEHGVQFIDVVRKLICKGKQVIILSHNKGWIERVRTGCRSLNGVFYEITGYTKDGPVISQKPWCSWKQRLDEVDSILKDGAADSVRLQQAEEEIRIVVCDLVASIYFKSKGMHKDASTLNSGLVRKSLIECNVPMELVDRIGQTFETTDDSHHTPEDYAAQRQRIRCYHGWSHDLAKLAN